MVVPALSSTILPPENVAGSTWRSAASIPATFSGGKMVLDSAGAARANRRACRRKARPRQRAAVACSALKRGGRREHGQCGGAHGNGAGQGFGPAHADRVRRRRAAACRARRGEARHRPRAHSGQCQRRLRGRAFARAGGLRDRARPADAARKLRPPRPRTACSPTCAPRPKPSCAKAHRTPSSPSSAQPSCAIAAKATRLPSSFRCARVHCRGSHQAIKDLFEECSSSALQPARSRRRDRDFELGDRGRRAGRGRACRRRANDADRTEAAIA